MTDSTPGPRAQPERLSLSVTQLLASVLAAVSASVAASFFGVAGTVIGAGLGSAISVVGSAVYAHSIKRSRNAVRSSIGAAAGRRRFGVDGWDEPDPAARPGRRHRLRLLLTPQRLALGAGALFVLTLVLITGFELLTGQPVAASVSGKHGSGVSVLGGTEHSKPASSPPPSVTSPSATGSSVASTPTAATQTGTVGPTATVTVTETPSATPSGTSAPTDTPTSPAGTAVISGTTGGS